MNEKIVFSGKRPLFDSQARFSLRTAIAFVFLILASPKERAQAEQTMPWRPTHSAARAEEYAGTVACRSCHSSKFVKTSQMSRSIIPASQRSPDHPRRSFKRGPYTYTVRLDGEASLTVQDRYQKITEPIFAVVGAGEFFQSYLIRHNGVPYRAAVDYVSSQHALALDNEADPAPSLEAALGRSHSEKYVQNCFACHSPASVAGKEIDLVGRPLGNTCEVCHGPGASHVAMERAGPKPRLAIFNPGRLSAGDESEFCGQCHTTASVMREQKVHGVQSVISEPYRLEGSRCWNPADQRISCTGCHDPHQPIVRKSASYDGRCLSCHARSAGSTSAHPCPLRTRNCVRCHMPRVSLSDTPIVYFDHRIRVVKAGEPFPE